MEDSEGTVRQIGAFSEGINNLTVRDCPNEKDCSFIDRTVEHFILEKIHHLYDETIQIICLLP